MLSCQALEKRNQAEQNDGQIDDGIEKLKSTGACGVPQVVEDKASRR